MFGVRVVWCHGGPWCIVGEQAGSAVPLPNQKECDVRPFAKSKPTTQFNPGAKFTTAKTDLTYCGLGFMTVRGPQAPASSQGPGQPLRP